MFIFNHVHIVSNLNIYSFSISACHNSPGNMRGSPGDLSEELVMQVKRKKGWRMSCDVGEVTEILENEQSS